VEKKINLQIRLLCSQGQVKKKWARTVDEKGNFIRAFFIPFQEGGILFCPLNTMSFQQPIKFQNKEREPNNL